jgi:hypothetical protein
MSSIVVAGDTSGTVTLQAPAVAGSTVLTLPAQTGTVMVNGPAFSAYKNSTQTAFSGFAKVKLDFEEFDTANCFDSVTNYRFTPNVAGYYQVNGCVTRAVTNCDISANLYKNGSIFKYGNTAYGTIGGMTGAWLVYMNGSTDYLELYAYMSVSQDLNIGPYGCYFQAFLARSA